MKYIDEKQLIKLCEEGKKDTEIAKIFNVGRRLIGKYRKKLNIQSYKEKSVIHNSDTIDKIKELSKSMSINQLSKYLNITRSQIESIKRMNDIPVFDGRVITPEVEKNILKLYEEGKTDAEISRLLNINDATIQYYRKTHNLKTKFTYDKISKIDNKAFEKLFYAGLNDDKIATALGMSAPGIYSHRMRHNYIRENRNINKEIPLTDFQKQVLVGTVLGDSSLIKNNLNAYLRSSHCVKQKEYSENLAEVFKSIGGTCAYKKRNKPDKRNGIYYESYDVYTSANPALNEFYNAFYPFDKKIIPIELLNKYFTEISLAYMFMDDGSKASSSYVICTNCFELENLKAFQQFLLDRFNLETSICKSRVLYVRVNSKNLMTYLISPYICDCIKYKLHKVS